MKRYSFRLIFLTIAFMPYIAFSQKQSDLDRLYWSDRERIAVADFGIQTQDTKSGLSSAAFSLEYNIHGMNFMTKNFNKKVTHFMVRSPRRLLSMATKHNISATNRRFSIWKKYTSASSEKLFGKTAKNFSSKQP